VPETMSSYRLLLVDRPAPHVARILIHRPEKRNAMDYEVRQSLIDAVSDVLNDPTARALVFGGSGGVFSAGGDVPSMIGLSELEVRARMRHIHRLCTLVAEARLPVVTAIEGVGAGAAIGLALLGDYIVAGTGSKVLFPFMKLGLTPDWGTLLTLPRRVGLANARRMLTSGEAIQGPEALHTGLADEVVADSEVMDRAVAKAAEWAKLPLGAFARMKMRVNHPSASLAEEFEREANDQAACLLGAEFAEGYEAFIQKRPAFFNGAQFSVSKQASREAK